MNSNHIQKQPVFNFATHRDEILRHLIAGEIRKGKGTGIHFFDHGLHRIEHITKPANEQGIWEAIIQVRHPKTNAWVSKKKASTFFPKTWSKELLLIKLEEAFQNKQKIYPYKFLGKTACDIPIYFFYSQEKITSCFPVYV